MKKRYDSVLYLVSWDDDRIVKIGVSDRRRWRRFNGARVLARLTMPNGVNSYEFERVLHRQAFRVWPLAFRSGAEAIPYLGHRGSGYLECYRATADEALDLLASQCHVTVPRHIVTSQCHVALPRHGLTDGRTDGLTEKHRHTVGKLTDRNARARGSLT